jgi:hypothetical protein
LNREHDEPRPERIHRDALPRVAIANDVTRNAALLSSINFQPQ